MILLNLQNQHISLVHLVNMLPGRSWLPNYINKTELKFREIQKIEN